MLKNQGLFTSDVDETQLPPQGTIRPLDLGPNARDDTSLVSNAFSLPLVSICRLYSTDDQKSAVGTGVVIDDHHVLTAGHVAHQTKDWIVDQCYDGGYHFPERFGVTHSIHERYENGSNLNFDIGVIQVDETLFYPLEPNSWQASFERLPIYVCGYSFLQFDRMRFHEGQFLKIEHNLAAHNCDAFRGQSGSPVIHGGDTQTLFLGLHVGGNEYAANSFPKNSNKCILFSEEIVNWIQSI